MEDKRPNSEVFLPGGRAVVTLQRTVDRVLLPKALKRHVVTNREGFLNHDRWTIINSVSIMCERSQKVPLTLEIVRDCILSTNKLKVNPHINIPMQKPPSRREMKALVGGAYHESFHTLYDYRKDLPISYAEQIFDIIGTRIKWHTYHHLITFWDNEFCDVRIEQLGAEEFPLCRPYIREVHRQRIQKLEKDLKKDGLDPLNASAFAFRHFAFGYKDAVSSAFLKIVRKRYKNIVELFAPGGRFHHYVESAKDQAKFGILRSIQLTFQLLADLRDTIPAISDASQIFYRHEEKLRWGLFRIDGNNLLDLMLGCIGVSTTSIIDSILGPPKTDIIPEQKIIHVGQNLKSSQLSQLATTMIKESRRQISYYRSRLRTRIKALEIVRDTHGVQDGIDISDECLVDIRMDLKSQTPPERFEWEKGEDLDTSTAAYVLFDKSGSMARATRDVAKVALSLLDPLESLQCKTMASGFESSHYSVNHHIYKHWDENYQHIKWRFPLISALGGTPMAEGMQFALNALQSRPEGNRVLFVITDGWPNNREPIPELIRVAEEAGIVVIGIGFGNSARYVETLFSEGCSVWEENVSELPPSVVKKLLQKLNPDKRGRKMKRQVLANLRWSA